MKKLAAIALLPAVLLAGCSGEPSQDELDKAVRFETQKELKALNSALGGRGGIPGMPAAKPGQAEVDPVKSVKKIGCKEDGTKAYLCDFEIEATMGDKVHKATERARMVKGSDGWVMTAAK